MLVFEQVVRFICIAYVRRLVLEVLFIAFLICKIVTYSFNKIVTRLFEWAYTARQTNLIDLNKKKSILAPPLFFFFKSRFVNLKTR